MSVAVTGFSGLEELHRGATSLVLRAIRDEDGRRVVLKTTNHPHPSQATIAALVRELRLARRASGPRTVQMLGSVERDGVPVLVMEDADAVALDRVLAQDPPAFGRKLELACAIARAVAAVHERGVIHKDVNPTNIVLSRATGEVRLIDFGIATELERERPILDDVHRLEGTLHYIAPEQTGRTSRRVDRRSDLYSLGVTLYELFTGRRPFSSHDALELVHAHLARKPLPMNAHDDSLPEVLSTLVTRLLAKSAENRYQTAEGLAVDLEECLARFRASGRIEPFPLGAADRPARLEAPERLYGREAEVAALAQAFERVAGGARELVLVGGYSGIGKTSLVQELLEPVTARRGAFLAGKFDPLRLGIAYEPLGNAVGRLLQSVLTSDEAEIARWRRRLAEAVGHNAGVLAELLPELELLLGGSPPSPELPAGEAENRFQLTFRALVAAIATAEHPVVLFLDDVQWADLPTLRLLEGLACDEATRHLLLVGAYRSNEVDDAHPLTITRRRLEHAGVAVPVLELGPPREAALRQLLADAFARDDAELDAFAERCIHKTGGNPFFLQRFLAELVDREAVRWDADARRWTWDLAALEELEHTENLVAFLVERLEELPGPTRAALSHAACVGGEFDLRDVAPLLGLTPAGLQRDLAPAVGAGLVAPRGKGWRLEATDAIEATPDEAFRYAFEHDRILGAAYGILDAGEARRAHRALGERLLAQGGERAFEAVGHLNQARELLDGPALYALAVSNLDAGRRARRAAAFGAASVFFEAGLAALPADAWARDYALTLDLTLGAAECAYLVADFALSNRRLEEVHAHAATTLDRVGAWRVDIAARIAQQDLHGAIAVARAALAELGVALPEHPGDAEVGAAVGRAMTALGEAGAARIEALPDAEDPRVLAATTLLVEVSSPAYYALPALLPIIACELVATSVEEGPSVGTPFGLAVYGIVLNAIGMLPQAHEIGRLAHRLLDRWEDRHLEARTRLVVHNNVCVFTVPLQRALDDLLDTYRVGRASGDLEFAAIAGQAWATNAFVAGFPLAEIERTATELGGFMRSYQQNTALALHRPLEQLVRAFLGHTETPASLSFDGYDEAEALAAAERAGSASLAFVVLTDMLVARYHFGDADEAWRVAEQAAPYQAGAASTHHLTTFHTYAPLAAARCYERAAADEALRAATIARMDASLAQLEAWSAAGPANFRHRLLLVRAERARVTGAPKDAERLYREALDAARETDFVNDEALIAELTGRFHLGRGGADASIGRAFLEDARFAYQRWGAAAKTAALEAELPHVLGRARGPRAGIDVTLGSVVGLDLDAAAMVRAAQSLSASIELDELLRALFRTAVEAAGAERALLLIEHAGRWEITLEGYATGEPERVARPLDDCDPAEDPVGILRYVLRTGRPTLVADATERGGLFATDPYVVAKHTRSVHCLPLAHRGATSAVLYLEHANLPGVFTERGAGLMQLLISQAAVSLENAKLYEAQRQLTRQQSRFVPHEFLVSLGKGDLAEVALGQHVEKTMTVLFSDLRRFTHLVERLGARAIVEILNDYFAAMEEPIVAHGGFIDSFNGDEIMALFDGPADRAVHAAVAMQRALARFNARGVGTDRPALQMGVGVNTGPLLLGIVGGKDRIKCGVVGDAVNLASRLEQLTRQYGAAAIVGEATWTALEDPSAFVARRIDRVIVKGAETPVTLYEILDAETGPMRELKERTRTLWEQALDDYFARDFESALELCGECLALSPRDRLPMILANRCTRYQAEPPPEGWTGVERLLTK